MQIDNTITIRLVQCFRVLKITQLGSEQHKGERDEAKILLMQGCL